MSGSIGQFFKSRAKWVTENPMTALLFLICGAYLAISAAIYANDPASFAKDAKSLEPLLEHITRIATIIAIPWVSYRFLVDIADRKRKRNAEIFVTVDKSLRDSLELAIAHPALAVGPYEYLPPANPPGGAAALTPARLAEMQQAILYDHITAMFEATFLAYNALREEPVMHAHWQAWRRYIGLYCAKPSYTDWLTRSGLLQAPGKNAPMHIYNPDFETEIRKIHAEFSGAKPMYL
jgi:hypothetical protein